MAYSKKNWFFLSYAKMSLKTHQLNIAKEQRKATKKACGRHQNLPAEEKEKKCQYGWKGYKKIP